ncbi:TIM barrel protein [Paeniroseomonas aquatica]|uniref:TIM barrel protein n=1 Tax=Paeniroseomonas aquatica TaxID=373043 RepID=UPI003607ADE4
MRPGVQPRLCRAGGRPFTLDAEAPHLLPASRRAGFRRAAAEAGTSITGLHWLLIAPAGLSITSADPAVRARTLEVIERLIGLAADLGAQYLVHGSPAQRQVVTDGDAGRAEATMARIAAWSAAAGVTYCLEPLAARRPTGPPRWRRRSPSSTASATRRCAPCWMSAPPETARPRRSPPCSTAGCRPAASPIST